MPQETRVCPHCEEEMDQLDFSTDITSWGQEYGTCDFDGDNRDYGDTEYSDGESGETRYMCPSCGDDIDLSELEDQEGKEEEEEEEEEIEYNEDGVPMHKVEEPKPKITLIDTRHYSTVQALICPDCGNDLNPYDNEDEAKDGILCTKCGNLLTKETAEVKTFGK